ncbi:MAG TPA: bifunctional indole-3-glycerol-phosphate synthase TrpC/phosphoribosylanthranilate isomerase TrpF [Gemmatimonadaceae bacterium]|nr:bifunctional indole-3-glycerol-phosphate synthase TrpC/phosphoribosylanthranilate isomerase TrpF [Gemmatimonadaceae bacterium]
MLDAILEHKRGEIAARKTTASVEGLLSRATRSDRSFSAAVRSGHPGFVLEIKSSSPSTGVIRSDPSDDLVIGSYGRHADAVSVLTDATFFGGSLHRLARVREQLDQPLLCKDFILEPFQVIEARVHGADAILLILAAIDDDTWRACALQADRLGMQVVTEVHDEREAARAVALGVSIIGINNRNLRTLEMDISNTARVARAIPPNILVIAESGIATRETVVELRPHADAFLIGSALMREPDIDRAVRALVYGRTKICGVTTTEDAAAALEAGATHGGLVFAHGSPRTIADVTAARIVAGTPLEWVGVFVDQAPDAIASMAHRLELAAVQLHGAETDDEIAAIRARVPSATAVWKAERVQTRLPAQTSADRLLLDSRSVANRDERGAPFDWSLLEKYPERPDVILAGGIHAENVESAAGLGTWALDASSGVESVPGRKDAGLLRNFFKARRRLSGRGDSA